MKIKKKFNLFIFEKIKLPFNRLKSYFGVKFEGRIPRIIVHEKFNKHVKYANRVIISIGIISSIIAFSAWYFSLLFAVLLFCVGWTLEKVIFRFTTIFVTPLPDFTYDPSEWNAMGYMFVPDELKAPSLFGPSFKTEEYGINLFNLLLAWNYNKDEDKEENICISFIEEKDAHYSVYIYPNLERKSIEEFAKEIKESDQFKGKDHHQLVIQMTLCHSFPLTQNSHYHIWKNLFLKGQPTCLGAFLYDENKKQTTSISKINPIKVHYIKFKKRSELKRDELEYKHGKNTMGL